MYQELLGTNVLWIYFDRREMMENLKKLSVHKRLVSNRSENIAVYWTDPMIEVQVIWYPRKSDSPEALSCDCEYPSTGPPPSQYTSASFLIPLGLDIICLEKAHNRQHFNINIRAFRSSSSFTCRAAGESFGIFVGLSNCQIDSNCIDLL